MKAIAACDEITLQFDLLPSVEKVKARMAGSHICQLHMTDVEKDLSPQFKEGLYQILEDFMLRINQNAPPVRQFG